MAHLPALACLFDFYGHYKLHDQKQLAQKRVCFILKLTVYHEGEPRTRDRNLKAGTEAQASEEHCFLSCSPHLAQFDFLLNSEYLPSINITLISHWLRKCPHRHAHEPIWWRHFSIEVTSFQVVSGWQKFPSIPTMPHSPGALPSLLQHIPMEDSCLPAKSQSLPPLDLTVPHINFSISLSLQLIFLIYNYLFPQVCQLLWGRRYNLFALKYKVERV